MKKLFYLAIIAISLIACERSVNDNVQEVDQIKTTYHAKKDPADSTATTGDGTDPKDIIVPPRH